MTYAAVQMFMEKLKQLMYCNDIPMIANPLIIRNRPQFQLLYEERGSMIQTLFIDQDQDLQNFEKVRKLKKRFKVAVEEAEDIVDLFLSAVHFKNKGYFPRSDVYQTSLNLEDVMRSMESIKVEFLTIKMDNMKMESSQGSNRLQLKPADAVGPSRTRSKKASEEIVVGLDSDAEIIRDKLVEDRKQLDVVCIVGMGGIGKTTLATKLFTDPFVVYHFYVRAWVTVSQTFEKRDLLIQALSSMGVGLEFEKANDFRLREMLHKRLKGQRYLIVIDDIWSKEAWDMLKLFFPNDDNGSRILLTSRLTEVAWHANSHGLIHHLQHLSEEESWELLCGKLFQGDECPECLIEHGMQIAKGCHGLPLSVVVIAGILAKEERSKDVWVKIACSVGSYIASDQKGCLEIIALSYHHLPLHLKECFLYLGVFEEFSLIYIENLILLWTAEGFIQEDGSRTSREMAMAYMMELVDRNLIIIVDRLFTGDDRVCKVHDVVKQLCLEKAKEERFFTKIDWPKSEYIPEVLVTSIYRDEEHDFEVLHDLEILYLSGLDSRRRESTDPELLNIGKNHFRFPATLKELGLKRWGLRWSDMSIIQSLPNLEVLILQDNAFEGTMWETGEDQFQRLKFLRLRNLDIKQWEASSINFPCLERLEVIRCVDLEEIPLEIGDISMLEFLEVSDCGDSLLTSLQEIRQEQDDAGNDVLTITVNGRQLRSFVLEHDD